MNIRNVCNFETMLQYFGENLEWGIDTEDFNADEYYYELYVKDLGYDKKATITLIKKDNKLYVVEDKNN